MGHTGIARLCLAHWCYRTRTKPTEVREAPTSTGGGGCHLSIQQKETGSRIKSLLRESGYTVRDIQSAMGFENPQAVYKWISGKCLPSLDNFLILSRLLNTSIEDILVIDGDISRFGTKYRNFWKKLNCWYNDKPVIL